MDLAHLLLLIACLIYVVSAITSYARARAVDAMAIAAALVVLALYLLL